MDNFYDRASLTRLRTSSRRLEFELGRRNSTPRNERVCRWCKSHEHSDEIENEHHLIYKCSLNTPAKTVLINKIINLRSNYSLHPQDHLNLPNIFLHLINNDNNIPVSPSLSQVDQQHFCLIITNYVANCFKRRQKFIENKDNVFISTSLRDQDRYAGTSYLAIHCAVLTLCKSDIIVKLDYYHPIKLTRIDLDLNLKT